MNRGVRVRAEWATFLARKMRENGTMYVSGEKRARHAAASVGSGRHASRSVVRGAVLTLIWPLPMPSPIFMAYCKIMATSSSTAYSSPVSETTRAVPRSASLTTL